LFTHKGHKLPINKLGLYIYNIKDTLRDAQNLIHFHHVNKQIILIQFTLHDV